MAGTRQCFQTLTNKDKPGARNCPEELLNARLLFLALVLCLVCPARCAGVLPVAGLPWCRACVWVYTCRVCGLVGSAAVWGRAWFVGPAT